MNKTSFAYFIGGPMDGQRHAAEAGAFPRLQTFRVASLGPMQKTDRGAFASCTDHLYAMLRPPVSGRELRGLSRDTELTCGSGDKEIGVYFYIGRAA